MIAKIKTKSRCRWAYTFFTTFLSVVSNALSPVLLVTILFRALHWQKHQICHSKPDASIKSSAQPLGLV